MGSYVLKPKADQDLLILYRPLPDGVEILRAVHGSRNLQALWRREGIE
jgi:hypothetical protein